MKTAVVTFAFGTPARLRVNRFLAAVTLEEARRRDAIIYTQQEIDLRDEPGVRYVRQVLSTPPSTMRIARQVASWTREDGIEKIVLVCAEPHFWRVRRDLHYAIYEREGSPVRQICVSDRAHSFPPADWFDPRSRQPATQSRFAWMRRELLLRLLPFPLYARLAG